MVQQAVTDEVGVRFGIGAGVQLVTTGIVVGSGLAGAYGVAVLLVVTAVLAAPLNSPYALLLGMAGWSFATGFAVNALGVLTLAPPDLLRMVVFVVTPAATCRALQPR